LLSSINNTLIKVSLMSLTPRACCLYLNSQSSPKTLSRFGIESILNFLPLVKII